MATAIRMHQVNDDLFHADDGHRMEREYGETPNGNPLGGRWVLRSANGEFLDFDQYRHDLAERNGLPPLACRNRPENRHHRRWENGRKLVVAVCHGSLDLSDV